MPETRRAAPKDLEWYDVEADDDTGEALPPRLRPTYNDGSLLALIDTAGTLLLYPQPDRDECTPPQRHALAALALYGQPFGFTREDVALMDELVRGLDYEPERGDETAILDVMLRPEQAERLRPLAEKIRALLPP